MPVYDIPASEAPYWDALDLRVTCDACANAVGVARCIARPKGQEPAGIPHHCGDFARIARRPAR